MSATAKRSLGPPPIPAGHHGKLIAYQRGAKWRAFARVVDDTGQRQVSTLRATRKGAMDALVVELRRQGFKPRGDVT